ncbi:MAG: prolyl oligopeptidase family serine peptidase [Bdellovibrionia bacterium]
METQDLWLEEVEGPEALEFVKIASQLSEEKFLYSEMGQKVVREYLEILKSPEKPLKGQIHNGYYYEFVREADFEKGVFRRCLIEQIASPVWEELIDFSQIEAPWTYQRCQFSDFYPDRCFIYLSYGGKDANQPREFDLSKKCWLADYDLPLAKGTVIEWNQNSLLVTGGELTKSGYPRQVFLCHRGKPFHGCQEVFSIGENDIFVYLFRYELGSQQEIVINVGQTFYERRFYSLQSDLTTKLIPAPTESECVGLTDKGLVFHCYRTEGQFEKNKLYGISPSSQIIYSCPVLPEQVFLQDVRVCNNRILVQAISDVRGQIFELKKDQWVGLTKKIDGNFNFFAVDNRKYQFYFETTHYLKPSELTCLQGERFEKLRSEKSFFKSDGMSEKREWCLSKDGTKIPYTVSGFIKGEPQPTILNAYGGFYVSRLPKYLMLSGKAWLERGGLFVVGNIRGGSEFGSDWHDQVVKQNRMKCFEDMAAIAEDLVNKGYTTREKLGISGGSNGGLLVMGTMVHFPDICSAVLCSVPLIDMERYHLLLAGASWAGEYGTIEDNEEMKQYIESYNPYRQVQKNRKYPKVFFETSTYDDRVHPGHARRMYKKMSDFGHEVYYYEEMQGGHVGNVSPDVRAKALAMEISFFAEVLGLAQG